MVTPNSVQRNTRTGRVCESGVGGCVEWRNSMPLARETHAARTTRVMEASRRCSQVVAVTKNAAFTKNKREKMLRKKEITLPRSRSIGSLRAEAQGDSARQDEYNAELVSERVESR